MIAANDNPLAFYPGGRWERILCFLVEARWPVPRAELWAPSKSPTRNHSDRTEAHKLDRALASLVRAGLVTVENVYGKPTTWAVTAEGVRVVTQYARAAA